MKKTSKIIGCITVLLIMMTVAPSVISENVSGPSQYEQSNEKQGIQIQSIEQNYQKKQNLLDLAYITTEVGESPVDEEAMQYLIEQGMDPLQYRGMYIKWYKVYGKNAWGWTMFTLCARGIFLFMDNQVMIIPFSYAKVEWWCDWAWEAGDVVEYTTEGSNWGKVYAECDFDYLIGGSVGLWAYIKCFSTGYAEGDGGKL